MEAAAGGTGSAGATLAGSVGLTEHNSGGGGGGAGRIRINTGLPTLLGTLSPSLGTAATTTGPLLVAPLP